MEQKIFNGMTESQQESSVNILKSILADQHVLYIKTRNFHWNLIGPRFNDLHKMFEEQYHALELAIDETAERIRSLGAVAPGAMEEFKESANLKEEKGRSLDCDDATQILVRDHEQMSIHLRKMIPHCEERNNDIGTADFLTSLLRAHEKTAWMLRSISSL